MKTIDITNAELFKPLLAIKIERKTYDLHNDFDCKGVIKTGNEVILKLKSAGTENEIGIIFDGAEIVKSKYDISDTSKSATLSNLYRGKYEDGDNNLKETNEKGQKYFYLDFSEGQQLEVQAANLLIEVENI